MAHLGKSQATCSETQTFRSYLLIYHVDYTKVESLKKNQKPIAVQQPLFFGETVS